MSKKQIEQHSWVKTTLGMVCFVGFILFSLFYLDAVLGESTKYILRNYQHLRNVLLVCSLPFLLFSLVVTALATADIYIPFSKGEKILDKKQNKFLYYLVLFFMLLFLSYNLLCLYVYFTKL